MKQSTTVVYNCGYLRKPVNTLYMKLQKGEGQEGRWSVRGTPTPLQRVRGGQIAQSRPIKYMYFQPNKDVLGLFG